jgi:hypothetical protein
MLFQGGDQWHHAPCACIAQAHNVGQSRCLFGSRTQEIDVDVRARPSLSSSSHHSLKTNPFGYEYLCFPGGGNWLPCMPSTCMVYSVTSLSQVPTAPLITEHSAAHMPAYALPRGTVFLIEPSALKRGAGFAFCLRS